MSPRGSPLSLPSSWEIRGNFQWWKRVTGTTPLEVRGGYRAEGHPRAPEDLTSSQSGRGRGGIVGGSSSVNCLVKTHLQWEVGTWQIWVGLLGRLSGR